MHLKGETICIIRFWYWITLLNPIWKSVQIQLNFQQTHYACQLSTGATVASAALFAIITVSDTVAVVWCSKSDDNNDGIIYRSSCISRSIVWSCFCGTTTLTYQRRWVGGCLAGGRSRLAGFLWYCLCIVCRKSLSLSLFSVNVRN